MKEKPKPAHHDEEDDEYHDEDGESSESASDGDQSENELANDSNEDSFITSDEDNFGPSRRRVRSRRSRAQSQSSTKITRRTRNSQRTFDDDDDFHTVSTRGHRVSNNDDNLSPPRRKHLRERKQVNYQILPPPALDDPIEEPEPEPTTAKKANTARNPRRPAATIKRLFPTGGPFGGNDLLSVFGSSNLKPSSTNNSGKPTAIGGVADSESSDDELRRPTNSASLGPRSSVSRGKSTLSDSDPLGIDVNIDFSSVGGLDHYINQLKEMVYLPLMYPEVYKRFSITPPRGVLFHGPPGTGKTLMARALAASFSSEDRKVTFFMRKGADCLSKWVGEAERQLRLLFEEAKNKQPSIIFFDEIDGLAPVRSSKQEQIHASIVSTLLALMDGMDNRGQVIVIGATNRPDAVDPALRRPGRFDREFYFPLPDLSARKQILTIQTRKWDPPLESRFIEHIARVTKGYGGADLRALCTEAALSAIQTRYPQIYQSSKKLLIDPSSIQVSARDFLHAVDRIIPSSARSTSSLAAPLPKHVEPLLCESLKLVCTKLDSMIPRNKKLSSLEEAMFDHVTSPSDVPNIADFDQQEALKEFQTSRVFRPRLLIHGKPGMGQQYLSSATLHHLEGYHVQSFDLGTLFSDSTRTPEAAIIQLLVEVKRHTPSVIFIPNIDTWFLSLSPAAISTFMAFLRNLNPTDAVLVLGILEADDDMSELNPAVQSLFGYSSENLQGIHEVTKDARAQYFETLITYIKTKPSDFPETRKKRTLEELPEAPVEPVKTLTTEETQRRARKDLQLANMLKIKLSSIMDPLRNRYKRFRKPMVDDYDLIHLFEPQIAAVVSNPPYTKTSDDMILDVASGKKYYNMDLDVIEERLWNGFYLEPKQFLKDIRMIHADCITSEDRDRILKASEMLTNVEVFVDEIVLKDPQFIADCHEMYVRRKEKLRKMAADQQQQLEIEKEQNEGDLPMDKNILTDVGKPGDEQVRTNTTQLATAMAVDGSLSMEQVVASEDNGSLLQNGTAFSPTNPENGDVTSFQFSTDQASTVPNPLLVPDEVCNHTSVANSIVADIKGTDNILSDNLVTKANGYVDQHEQIGNDFSNELAQHLDQTIPFAATHVSPKSTFFNIKTDDKPASVLNEMGSVDSNPVPAAVSSAPLLPLQKTPSNGNKTLSKDTPNGTTPIDQVPSADSIKPDEDSIKPNTDPIDPMSHADDSAEPIKPDTEDSPLPEFVLPSVPLSQFAARLVSDTDGLSIEQLEQLNAALADTVWHARLEWDKTELVERLEKRLGLVVEAIKRQSV